MLKVFVSIMVMISITILIGIAVAYLIELIFALMDIKQFLSKFSMAKIRAKLRVSRLNRNKFWEARNNWGAYRILVEYHHGKDYQTINDDAVKTGDIITYYYGR